MDVRGDTEVKAADKQVIAMRDSIVNVCGKWKNKNKNNKSMRTGHNVKALFLSRAAVFLS